MAIYYTRVCNFYYGSESKFLIKKKKTLPLNGAKEISFDRIEIITRKFKKKISIKEINQLPIKIKKIIKKDINIILKPKKNFEKLNFKNIPNIMGILNVTPDSFSDGGKFNNKNEGIKQALKMLSSGANIVDVGGESTRPGSKGVNAKVEWNRINFILKSICKKVPISLDTRKSEIMEKGIKLGIKIVNDVSGLKFDTKTKNILKKYKIPFVIQHSQGTPENMQNNPSYKNELLDIYDFFEHKIKLLRSILLKNSSLISFTSISERMLKKGLNLIMLLKFTKRSLFLM